MSATAITVGVATCGNPEALERCLRALAGQDEPPAAVVVVDQAASAEARAVAEASGLTPLRYLEQDRLGLSASRNLALHSTETSNLAVTDDDCAPDAGWVRAVTQALSRPPEPEAVTGRILSPGEAPPGFFAVAQRTDETPADYTGRTRPWAVGSGANFAASVELLRAVGGWDVRLGTGSAGMAGEDTDLLDRVLEAGATVRYEPAAVVRHDWQTRERRWATRWSYGYGIGAMCGLRLARGDWFGLDMLAGYARLHLRPLLRALRSRQRRQSSEHARALMSLGPGILYGLRNGRRPTDGPSGA
jgi:GT2 family glycosyltransferase